MSQYVFGVDIGGTTVKLGYFDTEGNVLDKWEIPTRKEDNGSRILPDVAATLASLPAITGSFKIFSRVSLILNTPHPRFAVL